MRRQLWANGGEEYLEATRAQFDAAFPQRRGKGLLGRLQHHDLANYIAYDNLPKVDITTMYHSLEVRVPLLDHVFLETARQVPPELKLRHNGQGFIGKYLLKRAAERFFPPEFLHRPKRGFEVPVRDWFSGPYERELSERLTGPQSCLLKFFRRDALDSLAEAARSDRPAAWRAWTLLVLEEWLSQADKRSAVGDEPVGCDLATSVSSHVGAPT
jgi:asparagine synthase (glutamine-hydrolysing)